VGALATYRGLLGNRPLVRLLAGEFVSGIGDWLYLVALLVIVYRESTDPLLLGIVGGARIIPYIVLSVPAGIVADRFDRRIILLITDIARGLIMVALTVVVMVDGPLLAIVLLAILATCFSAFFNPTMGAYLPMLARDERELGPANSAFATLGEISFIIGPALAGILIAVAGLELAFAINAVTFAIIAIALLGLPSGKPGTRPMAAVTNEAMPASPVTAADDTPASHATTADATAASPAASEPGAASAANTPAPSAASEPTVTMRDILRPVAGLVSLDLVAGFMFGGISVLTVLLAVDRLGAGEEATGFLNAAIGVGGVLGAVGSGAIVLRPNLGPPLLLGAGILGVGFIILGAVDVLSLSLVAMIVVSGGALLSGVVSTTVFQRVVPDAIRGRTLGVMETIGTLAYAAGAFLLPTLVTQVGYLEVLGVGGVLIIISAVIAFMLLGPSLQRVSDPATEVLRRVSRLPLFAGVPPSALEAAAARLDPLDVSAGTVVIRQGDPADRFFLIESGSFAVDQADPETGEVRRLRVMGPDEVFGELGLMHQAPRSATVTAVADGRLLVLDGPEFLELLSAGAALSGLLLERYGTSPGSSA
jgi:MFS family permease